jgi:hypothetical protein
VRLDHLLSKEQRPGNSRSISQLTTSYSVSSDALSRRRHLPPGWDKWKLVNLCSVFWAHYLVAQRARRPRRGPTYLLTVARIRNPEVLSGLPVLLENCIASTSILFSKLQEPTVDALAPEADEGRG